MKMLKVLKLEKYKEMCNEYTIDEIKDYDYAKLKNGYSVFGSAINKLLMTRRLCLYVVMFFGAVLISPQIINFYNMLYRPVRRAGVAHYNTGKQTIIVCIILALLIIVYAILENRINCVIIQLEERQKDIDFYLFLSEIKSFDEEVNSRMLLFDKDDRINGYFDSNQKRTFNLFVLGVLLLIIGIIFIFAVLLLTLNSDIDNAKIISGFVTGVLIDFIGVIFIGMYNKTLESTLTLSNLINENRKTNFSAYITSKISDEKIRNETLSKLAVKIYYHEKN